MLRRAAAPALALVVLAAWPASAHTALSGSVPADGATTAPLEQVALSFSGRVLERLSAVTVVGPDGTDAADGAPSVDGGALVQPLDGPLAAGRWTVSYRVVAADGHPLTGQLAFTVHGAGVPPGTPAPTTTAAPRPRPAADDRSATSSTAVVGGLLAGALGLAALVVLRLRRGARGG